MIDYDAIFSLYDATPASVPSNNNVKVPDGKYDAIINSVRLEESQKGTPFFNWDFIIRTGDYANRHVFYAMYLTPKTNAHVKGVFEKLGFSGVSGQDYATLVFPRLLNGIANIQLKTGKATGDYEPNQIVYINGFTPADDVPSEMPF